jgi:hypothetical protein
MTDNASAPDRVQAAYRSLSTSATNLNAASNELKVIITVLEDVLKKLNLGISTWVTITGSEDPDGTYWSRDLGYARVKGWWGIALREASGNYNWDAHNDETWLFNDAPRWLRVEGVGKIPELLEKLTKQADDTAEKIRKKTAEAEVIARAITAAAAENSMPPAPMIPPPPSPTPMNLSSSLQKALASAKASAVANKPRK